MENPPPQPPRKSTPPYEGIGSSLNRIPVRSRIALTAGVAGGLFASIIFDSVSSDLSRILLWAGVILGVVLAIYFWIRAPR
jgi:Mn2+/Fe2+ NRAMP family transporter